MIFKFQNNLQEDSLKAPAPGSFLQELRQQAIRLEKFYHCPEPNSHTSHQGRPQGGRWGMPPQTVFSQIFFYFEKFYFFGQNSKFLAAPIGTTGDI